MCILPQYLANQTKPTRYMERYGLMAVVPTLIALLLSSLNDWQFFFVFFVRSLRVFVRKALLVNVPIAIFFLTVDCVIFVLKDVQDFKLLHKSMKPRPNDYNMPTQHIATLLGATCCVHLATVVLRRVGCCWLKFDHFQD